MISFKQDFVRWVLSFVLLLICIGLMTHRALGGCLLAGFCDSNCREITRKGFDNGTAIICSEHETGTCLGCTDNQGKCCTRPDPYPPTCDIVRDSNMKTRLCTNCTLDCTVPQGKWSEVETCTPQGTFEPSAVNIWKCVSPPGS